MISTEIVPFRENNYAYILRTQCGHNAVVDAGTNSADNIKSALNGDGIDLILCTHHHADHTGDAKKLASEYDAKIISNAKDGDEIKLGNEILHVIATPGHTLDAVCYHHRCSKSLFTGDTLFSLGCGRLFEGSPQQMWKSLQKISALPDDTKIYCGHEYTIENGEFCQTVEPQNIDLIQRMEQAMELRKEGLPTLPSTLWQELATNAFLRANDAAHFAELRAMKDRR